MSTKLHFASVVLSFSLLIFPHVQACAPFTYQTLPTHADRIQEAIRANAQKLAKSEAILKGHTYEIGNLEGIEAAQDDSLSALIHDEFTHALVWSGVPVVERDDDIVTHLLFEDNGANLNSVLLGKFHSEDFFERFSLIAPKPSVTFTVSLTQPSLPEYERYSKLLEIKGSETIRGERFSLLYLGKPLLERLENSTLVNPDYLIAIRIYECGVLFYPSEEAGIGEVVREARARFFVEIIDARKGTVILSNFLDSSVKDIIPEALIEPLGKVSYAFYGFSHPLTAGAKSPSFAPVVESTSPQSYTHIDLLTGIVFHILTNFFVPPGSSLNSVNPGVGVGARYNFTRNISLGFHFDAAWADATLLRTGLSGNYKIPLNDFLASVAGLKLGWAGVSIGNKSWNYLAITPSLGFDLGQRWGGTVLVEYNFFGNMGANPPSYDFRNSLVFFVGAKVGLW